MSLALDPNIDALAATCVDRMGDVFWDFSSERDSATHFTDPRRTAIAAIKDTLRDFAAQHDSTALPSRAQDAKVHAARACMNSTTSDEQAIDALTRTGLWTAQDATKAIHAARTYGASALREALLLAETMGIE